MALWPISSTTIMAVSWSSGWLMVTIWPSFIRCLITSEALTAILCASSATVMVSGTCTSCTRASAGADGCLLVTVTVIATARRHAGRRASCLRDRRPHPCRHGLNAFFLAGSPAQLLDSLADLTSLSPCRRRLQRRRLRGLGSRTRRPGLVQRALDARFAVSRLGRLGFFGLLGDQHLLGRATSCARMAAASASALRRRSPRSAASLRRRSSAGLGFGTRPVARAAALGAGPLR